MLWLLPSLEGIGNADSVNASVGMMDAASGVDEYISCRSVRPSDTTGIVAYTGMRVNRGMCLQQCAKAPRWAVVACVRRMKDKVEACLQMVISLKIQVPRSRLIRSSSRTAARVHYLTKNGQRMAKDAA